MTEHREPYPPPARDRLVPRAAAARPKLLVVVDTEEEFDWSRPFDRRNTGVEHMRSIHLFQEVCDAEGVRPVYVIDHPIATQETSIAPLRAFRREGRCEIGAHLHPWVSPPFEEEVNARNSYPGNLPVATERAKLTSLVGAIESAFGERPRAYKAGRYGAGPNTTALLQELGFEVDLSPCPPFDFGVDGGPDWSRFPCDSFWLDDRRRVLAIPNTGAYVGFVKDGAHGLYRVATSPRLRWARLPGILSRVGALERLFLSPEGYAFEDLRRLTSALRHRGTETFAFSLHSPSVLPGCTPYVRSVADRDKFLDTCRRYFQFFLRELGGVNHTTAELRAQAVDTQKEIPA